MSELIHCPGLPQARRRNRLDRHRHRRRRSRPHRRDHLDRRRSSCVQASCRCARPECRDPRGSCACSSGLADMNLARSSGVGNMPPIPPPAPARFFLAALPSPRRRGVAGRAVALGQGGLGVGVAAEVLLGGVLGGVAEGLVPLVVGEQGDGSHRDDVAVLEALLDLDVLVVRDPQRDFFPAEAVAVLDEDGILALVLKDRLDGDGQDVCRAR